MRLMGPIGPMRFWFCFARGVPIISRNVTEGTPRTNEPQRFEEPGLAPGRSRMNTKGELFAGLTVALITPFKGGQIDFDRLGKLVDWHIEQGTDCLAPVGTTGESPTLDHEEHERIIAFVCERAAGRIKIMPGTGSNSTREAVRLTRFAQKAGATGALMVGPYYNKPTQEGYYKHFAAVAEAVSLPIVLYNIPGRTGSNILPETMARLAKLPTIVAVKEATGLMDQASAIAALCDLTILSGDDSLTLPLLSIGRAKGVVSVVGDRDSTCRRHESAGPGFHGGQPGGGAAVAPQTVSAVPRHARSGDQSDSAQDGDEIARPRQRRTATAVVSHGRCRRGPNQANARRVRPKNKGSEEG